MELEAENGKKTILSGVQGGGQQKPDQAEVAALKREIQKLKTERDILKKPRPTLRRHRSEIRFHCEASGVLAVVVDVA